MRFRLRLGAVFFSAVLVAGQWWAVKAQDTTAIWSGVYTAAQADRGRAVVQTHCAECHHDDLSGGEGPALMGPTFMLKWETHTVERLFHKIRDTMPSAGSSDVSEQEKLDAVAFILQQNAFPAGNKELTDAAGVLASLRIMPKGGPSAPRAGAIVSAIGCLEESGADQWTLTASTEPQITTLDPMTPEQTASAALASGSQTIQLLSVFPSPVAIKGHKVIVKGLYITAPSGPRINVLSLASLSAGCGK